jgi:hypothetical protein
LEPDGTAASGAQSGLAVCKLRPLASGDACAPGEGGALAAPEGEKAMSVPCAVCGAKTDLPPTGGCVRLCSAWCVQEWMFVKRIHGDRWQEHLPLPKGYLAVHQWRDTHDFETEKREIQRGESPYG